MIPFNKPPLKNNKQKYVVELIYRAQILGDKQFIKTFYQYFEKKCNCPILLFIINNEKFIDRKVVIQ